MTFPPFPNVVSRDPSVLYRATAKSLEAKFPGMSSRTPDDHDLAVRLQSDLFCDVEASEEIGGDHRAGSERDVERTVGVVASQAEIPVVQTDADPGVTSGHDLPIRLKGEGPAPADRPTDLAGHHPARPERRIQRSVRVVSSQCEVLPWASRRRGEERCPGDHDLPVRLKDCVLAVVVAGAIQNEVGVTFPPTPNVGSRSPGAAFAEGDRTTWVARNTSRVSMATKLRSDRCAERKTAMTMVTPPWSDLLLTLRRRHTGATRGIT